MTKSPQDPVERLVSDESTFYPKSSGNVGNSGRWKRAALPTKSEDLDSNMDESVSTQVPPVCDEDSTLEPRPTCSRLVLKRNGHQNVPSKVSSVCVIGGGPAGLGCCRALCDAGLNVTLIQESRGLGGKLCTKYVNGKDDPTLHFDMGVQFIKPAGLLKELLILGDIVAPWPEVGRFKRVKCQGNWRKWNIGTVSDIATGGYVVGIPSMSSIGHYLAEQCKDLQIHVDRTAHVRSRVPATQQWEVEWHRGVPTGGQLFYRPELKDVPKEVCRGTFDAVVLAFESNKIARGCKSGYKMTQPSATPLIQRQVKKAKTCQLWNLMVAFNNEVTMPWDAASVEGHSSIAWVAVDSSKPGRVRVPQCFMVFSTREWANWKQWGKSEVERELLHEFLCFLGEVLGYMPPKPCFVMAGRWGNSTESVLTNDFPVGEFPLRATGFHEHSAPVVWDSTSQMGATGDWTRGFSVCDAYTAGHELAMAITGESESVSFK